MQFYNDFKKIVCLNHKYIKMLKHIGECSLFQSKKAYMYEITNINNICNSTMIDNITLKDEQEKTNHLSQASQGDGTNGRKY